MIVLLQAAIAGQGNNGLQGGLNLEVSPRMAD